MGKGTSCAEDYVVVEMLQELDGDILQLICETFTVRVLNRSATDLWCWAAHLIRLLRKRNPPKFFSDLRPIALLSALYRLYSKCMALLCDQELDDILEIQFAFRIS